MKATFSKQAWVVAGGAGARRAAAVVSMAGVVGALAAVGAGACGGGSSSSPPPQETPCVLNSDCNAGLICAIGNLCRVQCKTSADCGNGGSCVADDMGHAVCRSPVENNIACDVETDCPAPLACAADYRCRNSCASDADCNVAGITGRICALDANGAHYCADPPEVNSQQVIDKAPPALKDGGKLVAPAPPVDGSVPADTGVAADSGSAPDATAPGVDSGATPPDAGREAAAEAAVEAGGGGTDASTTVFPFTPSNFDPGTVVLDGGVGVDWSHAPAVVDTLTMRPPVTIQMNDGSYADLYAVQSFLLEQGKSIVLNGPRPVVIAALTTVDIQGTLSATPGTAGGFNPTSPGPGTGLTGGGGTGYPNSGGGGGSYCGVGGKGGTTVPGSALAPGGAIYGMSTLVPLVGGAPGGAVGCTSATNGGGAIQIVAGQSVIVRAFGSINMPGGSTGNPCGNAGGGSGGAILLEAPAVTVLGVLAANGAGGGLSSSGTANAQPAAGSLNCGAGSAGASASGADGLDVDGGTPNGAGGGGAGRIRINTSDGNVALDAGVVSPDLTTGCATTGTIQ